MSEQPGHDGGHRLDSARPDAAWIAGAAQKDLRRPLTDEERRTRRDWGRYMMAFYGAIALAFGGFAVVALSRDSGRLTVIAKRSAGAMVQPLNPPDRAPGAAALRPDK